jgi:hypothetical protein
VRATGGRSHFFRLCLALLMRVQTLAGFVFCEREQCKNKFTGGMQEGGRKNLLFLSRLSQVDWIFTSLSRSCRGSCGAPCTGDDATTFLAVCDFKSRVAPLTRAREAHETNAAESVFGRRLCRRRDEIMESAFANLLDRVVYFDNLSMCAARRSHPVHAPIILSEGVLKSCSDQTHSSDVIFLDHFATQRATQ